jgi:hypothetical protein
MAESRPRPGANEYTAIVKILRALYWPAGLGAGTLFFAWRGGGELASVWLGWAWGWPWLVPGAWLLAQGPLFVGRRWREASRWEAGCLVAAILAGTLVTSATRLAPRPEWMGVGFGEGMDLYDLLGERFAFEESLDWPVSPGTALEIRNMRGSVRVRPSPDDRVRMDVRKSIRALGRDEAARLEALVAFGMETGGPVSVIWAEFDPALPPGARRGFGTSLDVSVPATSALTLSNGTGALDVAGFARGVSLETRDGGVRVSSDGGPLDAYAERGDVRVVFRAAPGGAVDLTVVDGSLRLELPRDAGFELQGRVRSGGFSSDVPGVVSGDRDPETGAVSISGQRGGPEARIRIDVSGGDVRLRTATPTGFPTAVLPSVFQ